MRTNPARPAGSRPRRMPRTALLLVLLTLPLLEILGIIGMSRLIGGWGTLGLLALTGLLGAYLVRREGLRSWRALREATSSGRMPRRDLADAALALVGGLLILFPGFLTDIIGLVLLLPVTRPIARAGLSYLVASRVDLPGFGPRTPGPTWMSPGGSTSDPPGAGTTVRGTVIDED